MDGIGEDWTGRVACSHRKIKVGVVHDRYCSLEFSDLQPPQPPISWYVLCSRMGIHTTRDMPSTMTMGRDIRDGNLQSDLLKYGF